LNANCPPGLVDVDLLDEDLRPLFRPGQLLGGPGNDDFLGSGATGDDQSSEDAEANGNLFG
jgi:hypothetical protein